MFQFEQIFAAMLQNGCCSSQQNNIQPPSLFQREQRPSGLHDHRNAADTDCSVISLRKHTDITLNNAQKHAKHVKGVEEELV